jgi:P27 family predicted phage terminase small subunit
VAGRRPKPTALKELSGNPGKRALNKREPKLAPALPAAPAHLTPEERKTYRRLGKLQVEMGVMTAADGTALALLAVPLARFWEAKTHVDKLGSVVKTANGNLIQNPYLPVMNKAWEQVVKLLVEFGMTPSSRSRIQVVGTDAEVSLADILFAEALPHEE